MDIHCAGPAEVVVTPHPGQDLLPAPDSPGVFDEEAEQFVFHVRQIAGFPGDRCLVGRRVELQVAVAQNLVALVHLGGTAGDSREPDRQFGRIDRREHEVVEAVLLRNVFGSRAVGHEEHRQLLVDAQLRGHAKREPEVIVNLDDGSAEPRSRGAFAEIAEGVEGNRLVAGGDDRPYEGLARVGWEDRNEHQSTGR